MRIHRILFPALALLVAAAGARADAPNCRTAPPLAPGMLRVWPLHERLGGPDTNDFPGASRTGLMNSFGEFQHFDPIYVHTGLDIRGNFLGEPLNEGDFVLVAADGDVWAVPNFDQDGCDHYKDCRVYVKSTNRRHIYYYAHLNVREGMDSQVRAQLTQASMADPADDLPVGSNPVSAGVILAGLGVFWEDYTHLHFAIFDACENYDGLNPLGLLPNPDFEKQSYVDETEPTIGKVFFVANDGTTDLTPPTTCGTSVSGPVDILVEAKDAFHDLTAGTPKFDATDSNGIYKASYTIRRVPAGLPSTHAWYEFDRAPFLCRGPLRGRACADPDPANATLFNQDDFITLADIAPTGEGAPSLAVTYADVLFNNVPFSPFKSDSSFNLTERYFHTLTHGWGFPDQPGHWDTTALADGLYQVSAEVSDQAGNKAASHRFVILDNQPGAPSPTGDLLIRDNPEDVGAIPSTLGGKKFWISPDIKVFLDGDPAPVDPDDPMWSKVQDVNLDLGQSYKVWVRVENSGCETIHNVRAKVAWADPATIQDSWTQLGNESGAGVSLAPGEAKILGPFNWTPTLDQVGHRCLLSITRADEDQPTVPGFGSIVNGVTVAGDSNIGQLNLQIHGGSEFKIVGPRDRQVRLHFDCNDFPLGELRAVAELVTPYNASLAAAWTGVPRTELRTVGGQLRLRFRGCKVDLPTATLPAGSSVPASFHLELGPGPAGTYRVDLGQTVGGVLMGGMSFTIERP